MRAGSPLASFQALEGAPNGVIDGTERRRQHPTNAAQHKAPYSGKQKTPMDRHLVLINAPTTHVVSVGPTVAGKTHDKQVADAAHIWLSQQHNAGEGHGFAGL
jgi:hypothetical protein